jgi:hypothetical protein
MNMVWFVAFHEGSACRADGSAIFLQYLYRSIDNIAGAHRALCASEARTRRPDGVKAFFGTKRAVARILL